ncbi:DUF4375 domain-containing protein [Xinfangfangia sp. D13-10-4-6]|uniref:DMP19 family protein n=1 Tax=Pseudogemmobacter hezensis TaxID=2737662 RepID=UPI0015516A6F|nr:DUF4375 domain-containing protein [Pseudogemmobacter hezensis]NPD15702.1 DUF4375 domain-containing protein [Pseudogemmobacter hezensis]
MFSWFGKKAAPAAAGKGGKHEGAAGQFAGPLITKISLPETVFAPDAPNYAAAAALVDFANSAMHAALILPTEIPAELFWLYWTDYYIAQVNNGGHSQFFGNSAKQPGKANIPVLASEGLSLIQNTGLTPILKQALAWHKANLPEAMLQDGFQNRAAPLEDLDQAFYKIGSDSYYDDLNTWLRQADIVEILPVAKWQALLAALPERNPFYQSRKRTARILTLDAEAGSVPLGALRACAAAMMIDDSYIQIKRITSGSYHGADLLWSLETSAGPLLGLVDDEQVMLLAREKPDNAIRGVTRAPMSQITPLLESVTLWKPGRYAWHFSQSNFPNDPVVLVGFPSRVSEKSDPRIGRGFFFIGTQSGATYTLVIENKRAVLFEVVAHKQLAELSGRAFAALRDEVIAPPQA